jgi:hypothetical protein
MSSRLPTRARVNIENEISRSLSNILVAVEAYPELKLMKILSATGIFE